MRRVDWRSDGPKLVGAAMLVFCLLFWAATYLATGAGAVEPLFVTTGGGLLGLGLGAEALAELRKPPEPPPIASKTESGDPPSGGG